MCFFIEISPFNAVNFHLWAKVIAGIHFYSPLLSHGYVYCVTDSSGRRFVNVTRRFDKKGAAIKHLIAFSAVLKFYISYITP